MRSIIHRLALPCLLGSAMLASSCAPKVIEKPIFPPRADVQALVVERPKATPEIVADEEAYAAHNATVEVWGVGRWLAGSRICRWLVRQGADYDFCPPAPPEGDGE